MILNLRMAHLRCVQCAKLSSPHAYTTVKGYSRTQTNARSHRTRGGQTNDSLLGSKATCGRRSRHYTVLASASDEPGEGFSKSLAGKVLTGVGVGALAAGLLWFRSPPTGALQGTLQPPQVVQQASPVSLEMKAPKNPSTSGLTEEEVQNVELFIRNTPSVVNIANIASRQGYYSMNAQEVPQGTGSGFIFDNQGHIVTNFHVIRGASNIKVALIDQSVYPATVIGGDPDKDVAVLQLQCPPEKLKDLKPVELGTSANLLVGQKVFAIGNPFGLDHTLTQGIVSGVGRELAVPGMRGVPIKNVIQTDAAINPGNSGGVLLDSGGRLVGISTAIASPSGANSGVGFAIPIDSVRGLVDQILKYGRVVRPTIGITIAPPQVLRQIEQEGVLILEVPDNTPAARAGLKGTYRDQSGRVILGDVIQGINGQKIKLQRDLFQILDDRRPGDKITLTINRDGKTLEIDLTLGGREDLPLDQ